ncbi:major tail protein [Mycobacterium phage Madruga]|uniref:Major tail protein n=1 Tax=Mycobacterium phage Madruga TaxID=1675552 RepID=A0A0K1LS68_9CAUD|nr:major tail protein [Mycobacterium phage Madruga]
MTAPVADGLPYGVRDIKLTQYLDALGMVLGPTSVDLPHIQTLNFTEAEEFSELRGDDKLITTRGRGSSVNWDLESGGISIAAWAIFTGGSVIERGLAPDREVELQKKATQPRPWFRIDGKIISDSGGDVLVRIYRCRANGDISAGFTDGEFTTSSVTGVGYPLLDDTNDLLYSIFRRETSKSLTLTPDPNPLQSPLNLSVGAVTDDDAEVTWTPVVGAEEYKVEYSTSPFSSWTVLTPNPTVANATLASLTASALYRVRVSTIKGSQTSDPCPYVTFTTQAPSGG